MMTPWPIHAAYDPEADVCYSIDGDIAGLAAEGETLEVLANKAGKILPDLLDMHADLIVDKVRHVGSHSIHIIAHLKRDFDVAA